MGFSLTRKVTLKVDLKSGDHAEMHRITLASGTTISLDTIKETICSRVNLAKETPLWLSYQDEERDYIRLINDSDLEDAVGQKLHPLRILVKVLEPVDGVKENKSKETTPVTGTPTAPAAKSTSTTAAGGPAVVEEFFKNVRKVVQNAEDCAGTTAGSGPALMMEEIFKNVHKVVQKSEDRVGNVGHIVDSLSAMLADNLNRSVDLLPGLLNKRSSPSAETGTNPRTSDEGVPVTQQSPLEAIIRSAERLSAPGGAHKPETGKEPVPNEGGDDDFPARVFHSRVQCDGCGMLPIIGPRFKSTVKDDYDLCFNCYSRADDKQNYSRIDRPLFKPRHALWGNRHIRRNCGPPGNHFGGRPFVPAGSRVPPGWSGPHYDSANARGPLAPMGLGSGVHGDSAGPKGPAPPTGPMHGAYSDSESQHKLRDLGAWGANFYCKLDSRFVCDVSIFDGTELAPGTNFTKIWRMRNNGNTNWPLGTALTHIGGDTLANVSSVTLAVPPHGVGVDEEIDIAVDAVAPTAPGRYVSHWRLVAPNGPKFGHRVWMLIQVVPKGEISPQEAMLLKNDAEGKASEPVLPQQGSDASASLESAPASEPLPMEFFGSAAGSTSSSMLLVPPPPTPPTLEKGVSIEEAVKHVPTDVTGILSEAAQYLSQVAAREHSSAPDTELPAPSNASSNAGSSSEDSMSTKSTTMSMVAAGDADSISSPSKEKVDQVNVSGSDTPTRTENTSVGGFALLDAPAPPEDIVYPEVIAHAASPVTATAPEEVASGSVQVGSQNNSGEHASALIQLKAMGFHDPVLNVELLEKNGGDIQSTVDDLIAAEEWDPMLEELEEMGFTDVQVNRRLMFKNKGSVKQVVKELVEMYTSGTATLNK